MGIVMTNLVGSPKDTIINALQNEVTTAVEQGIMSEIEAKQFVASNYIYTAMSTLNKDELTLEQLKEFQSEVSSIASGISPNASAVVGLLPATNSSALFKALIKVCLSSPASSSI